DANVSITPSGTNEVGHQHVFQISTTALPSGTAPTLTSITPTVTTAICAWGLDAVEYLWCPRGRRDHRDVHADREQHGTRRSDGQRDRRLALRRQRSECQPGGGRRHADDRLDTRQLRPRDEDVRGPSRGAEARGRERPDRASDREQPGVDEPHA